VLTHCRRGEEIILGDLSHTFLYEAGGISALGGIHPHTVKNQPDGTMRLEDIEKAIRSDNVHFPRTRLICLENTHNRCNGVALKLEYMDSVASLAKKHGLSIHLDGARVFNAAVALGVDAEELAAKADSVSFCLSKGLSAPVGSVICGSREFISEARRARKILGGGMRQAGIIAAAGITALEDMVDRLKEDHENARRLANGIANISGLSIEPEKVQTNIIYFKINEGRMTAEELTALLDKKGVRMLSLESRQLRAVTHYGISAEDIDATLKALSEAMK
jgi:threonine aldolase